LLAVALTQQLNLESQCADPKDVVDEMLGSLSSSEQQALMANYLGLVNSDFGDPSWSDSEYFDFIDFTYTQGCDFYKENTIGSMLSSYLNYEYGTTDISFEEGISFFGNANPDNALEVSLNDISTLNSSFTADSEFNCENAIFNSNTGLTTSNLRARFGLLLMYFNVSLTSDLVDPNVLEPWVCTEVTSHLNGAVFLYAWQQSSNSNEPVCTEVYDAGRATFTGQLTFGLKIAPGSNLITYIWNNTATVHIDKFTGKGMDLVFN